MRGGRGVEGRRAGKMKSEVCAQDEPPKQRELLTEATKDVSRGSCMERNTLTGNEFSGPGTMRGVGGWRVGRWEK